jgi:HSP20 family protein
MSTLLPRLFGDMSEWLDVDFPRPLPTIRVEERVTEKAYVLHAELPGLDPEKDVQITALNGMLIVKAERRDETEGMGRSEFRYGMFHRSVRLPANADEAAITATYDKGILEVTVPLTEPESVGRHIAVTGK